MTDTALLNRIVVRWSDDAAKSDPELVCDDCDEHLCDVEHADTLAVIVGVATDHLAECPGDEDDKPTSCRTEGCPGDPDDDDAYDGYCPDCADEAYAADEDARLIRKANDDTPEVWL